MAKTENPHLAYATQMTRDGKVNMSNRKPYRTKAQKAEARETAYKTKDGYYHSPAPVSYHPVFKESN